MKVAFYKAKYGNIYDKLISIYTKSKYSHCEVVFENNLFVSSSPRDNGVRKTTITDLSHWDIFYLDLKEQDSYYFNKCTKLFGRKYDWIGIFFSQLLKFNIESKKKFYCSEFCSFVLELEDTNQSPQSLFEHLKNNKIIRL